jgi:hypothetical protein
MTSIASIKVIIDDDTGPAPDSAVVDGTIAVENNNSAAPHV